MKCTIDLRENRMCIDRITFDLPNDNYEALSDFLDGSQGDLYDSGQVYEKLRILGATNIVEEYHENFENGITLIRYGD